MPDLARATQLQKTGELEEAFHHAINARSLFEQDRDTTTRWRKARADERIAEILLAQGKTDDAWYAQSQAVAEYRKLGRRRLPLGASIDPARSMRVLAEIALKLGRKEDADKISDEAVRKLHEVGEKAIGRFNAEALSVLATRAEVVARSGKSSASVDLRKISLLGHSMLHSTKARSELEWRIELAEARLMLNEGRPEEALMRLELLEDRVSATGGDLNLVECKVEALVSMGRRSDAAQEIILAVRQGRVAISEQLFEDLAPLLGDLQARDKLLQALLEQTKMSTKHERWSSNFNRVGNVLGIANRHSSGNSDSDED